MSASTIVLIILVISILILIKGLLPLGAVGLSLTVVLVSLGIIDASSAMKYYISDTCILIPCVYILGEGLFESGISDKIGDLLNGISGIFKYKGENITLLLVILISGVACLLLPRYGVTGALMPVTIALARSTKVSRTKLLLVLAMAANIWGNNTLVSTPPNMMANSFLIISESRIFNFFEFALIGIPIAIAGTITLLLLNNKFLPKTIDENLIIEKEFEININDRKAVSKIKSITMSVIFIIFVFGLVFEDIIGIKGTIIGIFCVVLVIAFGILREDKAFSSVGWGIVFFIAGIQILGKTIETTGAGNYIASVILKILGDTPNPFFITGILFLTSATLTQFMSNTGAAGLLFPIALSIANSIGANPHAVIMAVAMGCGASFVTPMATPSNVMVMDLGKIQFKDFIRIGISLMIVTATVCIVGIPIIWPFY